MSQRCPVCKTRLWADPLFSSTRLKCPRCEAVFKATVPWGYFRLVLLVLLLVVFVLVLILSEGNLLPVLFLAGAGLLLWFLPRLIDLYPARLELTLPEGVMAPDAMKLKWEDSEGDGEAPPGKERDPLTQLAVFGAVFLLMLFLVILLRR